MQILFKDPKKMTEEDKELLAIIRVLYIMRLQGNENLYNARNIPQRINNISSIEELWKLELLAKELKQKVTTSPILIENSVSWYLRSLTRKLAEVPSSILLARSLLPSLRSGGLRTAAQGVQDRISTFLHSNNQDYKLDILDYYEEDSPFSLAAYLDGLTIGYNFNISPLIDLSLGSNYEEDDEDDNDF